MQSPQFWAFNTTGPLAHTQHNWQFWVIRLIQAQWNVLGSTNHGVPVHLQSLKWLLALNY